jgi:hypothetical protein
MSSVLYLSDQDGNWLRRSLVPATMRKFVPLPQRYWAGSSRDGPIGSVRKSISPIPHSSYSGGRADLVDDFKGHDTKTVTVLHRHPEEPVVAVPMRDMMTAGMDVRSDGQRTALPDVIRRRPRSDLVEA